ncbi:patatin-like phospholipase family protein [Nitratireductor luteus]|uniref:patatin-like phospholipase family protein n=1 Tax=Nitratireductor luteus TaxID=2976980 RepID=UPI00223ED27C|nr:patatin-like phospholipase family protein [Nitratireductor luteus]
MPTPTTSRTHVTRPNGYAQTALVLQGGGALGAYQAGVYQGLSEAGYEPDWLSGISIGAINAAIIAGNEPVDRLSRLTEFWELVTSAFPWPAPISGGDARRMFNAMSAGASMAGGQPGFFSPRLPSMFSWVNRAPGALSAYDTAPLRKTLEQLVDFDRINSGRTRLSLGAVNIRLGNFAYFDSSETRITADHVMASGALPPGFPPICINGEHYWDGGLVSNTPLSQVLDAGPAQDTLVFQVDLFSARGELPRDLLELEMRRKQIVYSSRTRLNTDQFRERHALRRAIAQLFDQLPPEAKQSEEMQRLRDLGADHKVSIVHLIYRRRNYEGQALDYEFSKASMEEHWRAGHEDAQRTLRHPLWLEPPSDLAGVRVCDIGQTDLN